MEDLGVGIGPIGGISDGRRFFAYRSDVVGEVDNFIDFISILSISTVTATDYLVTVMVGSQ
jgi:hypothetical protein